ncbi:MAG: MoaD/ThiS family protein [Desulfobacteraceae bacterium]|nr:MoaD/ThiS family protein [Desulfobacteraceae bacterium]
MVKVRVYGNIRESLNGNSPILIDIGQRRIRLKELIGKLPGGEEPIKKNIAFILVNGRNCIFADGMDTEIGADDVVDVLSVVVGG